ncbi:membrane dipeptidase [Paenibacillus mesophilus]|uniref:dipeptidase n=1 Tax=Paenibacillus mesophilus TaxID=2582849 RepID=UPI00110E1DE3|nr:dipeptidase [Paenibacillus mesophilus]TMV52112.1 membrane dipeptidase [Paenibacillus mesophilus]
MKGIIDAHCDVLSKLMMNPALDFSLDDSGLDVTLPKLRQAGVAMQCFAVWIPEPVNDPGMKHLLTGVELFWDRIVGQAGMKAIRTAEDLSSGTDNGQQCALLTVEGADALNGSMDHLRTLFQLGVRCLGITWNYANWAADGVAEPRKGGLTLKGRQLVKECNNLGMIMDISHLAERSFWELDELSSRPYIASHSNVLELCGHPRNLNKRQIERISERGGVIGINFFPPFVSTETEATIDHVIRHIDTVCEWGGERSVALGSDFDGISKKVKGLEDPSGYARLGEALAKRFSNEQVERICVRNWYEFFVTQLPKSEC